MATTALVLPSGSVVNEKMLSSLTLRPDPSWMEDMDREWYCIQVLGHSRKVQPPPPLSSSAPIPAAASTFLTPSPFQAPPNATENANHLHSVYNQLYGANYPTPRTRSLYDCWNAS